MNTKKVISNIIIWGLRFCTTMVLVLSLAACEEKRDSEIQTFDSSYSDLPADTLLTFPDHWPDTFGFGRPVAKDEIQEWDIDVRPDGLGLPAGSGAVSEGRIIYNTKCSVCHGATGTEGPFDKLVGREPREDFPFGKDTKYSSMKTIGNYWPYATTLFDYIRRAMPQTEPGSLTSNEVYALSAYLLHLNEIIPADAVMDSSSLPKVIMPARDRFVIDNRKGGNEIR